MTTSSDRPASDGEPSPDNRRSVDRHDVTWAVDCVTEDTFLFASITNVSALGIFVRTLEPLPIGARLTLSFAPSGHEPFKLAGEVAWVNPIRPGGDNPNPGMGVRFIDLELPDRERLVEVIKSIAYLRK
jgi:type IV pilus assembly protein PilZ